MLKFGYVIHTKEKFLEVFGNEDDAIRQVFVEGPVLEDLTITSKNAISHTKFSNTFKRCKFNNVSFNMLITSHATFEDCTFNNCEFYDSLFEYTKFINCNFTNVGISGKYITDTTFKNCKFYNLYINNTTFNSGDVFFDNCEYLTCLKLKSVTFRHGRIVLNDEDIKHIICTDMICYGLDCVFPKIYNIGPIGSRGDCTYYIPSIDWIKCGCWGQQGNISETKITGGTLEDFEKRVLETYPEGRYHNQYMAAIAFFKEMKANDKKE